MRIFSTYSVRIKEKEVRNVLKATTALYRKAVDFFINVRLQEDALFNGLSSSFDKLRLMEQLTVKTKARLSVKYDFSVFLYKFPCYYRRAAIQEALGKVDLYKSNLANWETSKAGKKPSFPRAGCVYPSLYEDNVYVREDSHTARLKVWIHNTWDWITVSFNKGDVDYILHHCSHRMECAPTLQKRGKEWFLDFPFKEEVKLHSVPVEEQIILSVDLGINSACCCVAMRSDGTILSREFLQLPREKDSLNHAVNRIKKAQQHGAKKTPRLWAKANGINDRIAVLTAQFIVDKAVQYNVSTIVFEHLDFNGKKHGTKKQRLALWKKQYVQSIVTNKAHRLGLRISHVSAAYTSQLAFDGSGKVKRGKAANKDTDSICIFTTGKEYNCDLNAAYNIGARYYIRELLKSLPVTERLGIEAKVPQCTKRNTCTLSTLIKVNTVLAA